MGADKIASSSERYLHFVLSGEEFAIPLLSVREVIALPEITPIPYSPSYFLGLINLRGQILSVLDLRKKFELKAENSAETTVVICDLGGVCLGVVVDAVESVLPLSASDIQPKPEVGNTKFVEYISGVTRKNDQLIVLLNIGKILGVEDYGIIQNAAQANQKAA